MVEQFDRLSKYSLDPDNQKMYAVRKKQWEQQAQNLRNNSEYQERISQKKEEWKKQHSEFDKTIAKAEINDIKSQIENMQKQINASLEKEKPLEKKVYIDGTGTDEDMKILRQSAIERKKMMGQIGTLNNNMLDKQEAYQIEAQNRILRAGIVEEIKLSKKMTPETVDALEDVLTELKDRYGIMPKGVVYNPLKVPDATATYNWLDDKIYISNKFNDINNYADVVKKSEASLIEYREKSGMLNIQKEKLKGAEKILSDKNIKGYEREKAIINKAEAEIEINIQRMAVRENLMDTIIHEYGHFIHRHANKYYTQKQSVFGAKELGGKFMNGDWKYDINSRFSANAKIEAAKISKYATESPYEAFAEGFLAKEKGQKIPESIEKVIEEAKIKAGAKNIANAGKSGTIKLSNREVREKYIEAVSNIKNNIDPSLSMEERARKAFEARNRIRTQARDMMADMETRKMLDSERPNKTFEELIQSKMDRKGMTREEAIQDIYKTATKTNDKVNKELGLGGD